MSSTAELSYAATAIEQGYRQDGRTLQEFRPCKLKSGKMPQSNGSASLTIGDTSVVVGCKLETIDSKIGARLQCSVSWLVSLHSYRALLLGATASQMC